jgi:Amidase
VTAKGTYLQWVSRCSGARDKVNPKLNAFITVLRELALEQATLAESEIKADNWPGPLHSIPVGNKDFYDTAGITEAFELTAIICSVIPLILAVLAFLFLPRKQANADVGTAINPIAG